MPKSWVIGSRSDCEVVVESTTVSNVHCKLTRTPEGLKLEDLNSTNGTYVNGQRVKKPVMVSGKDAITLGKTVPMPWPKIEPASRPRIIRVGQGAENDIVLDQPMISRRHAQIVVDGDYATIEDLNSTNGVAIGSPDRKIKHAPIFENDTVFFGSYVVPAAELLKAAIPPPVPAVRPNQPSRTAAGVPPSWYFLGGGVLAILAVAMIVLFMISGRTSRPELEEQSGNPVQANAAGSASAVSNEPKHQERSAGEANPPTALQKVSASNGDATKQESNSGANSKKSPVETKDRGPVVPPMDSLALLCFEEKLEKGPALVPFMTAWPVNKHHYVTRAGRLVASQASRRTLVAVTKNGVERVVAIKYHPHFPSSRLGAADANNEELFALFLYDVALIEVAKEHPATFTLAEDPQLDKLAKSQQGLACLGFDPPKESESLDFRPAAKVFPVQIKPHALAPNGDPDFASITANIPNARDGSPILSDDGRVAGILILNLNQKGTEPAAHQVLSAERVRELLAAHK